jgi:mycothiol synthase
MQTRELSATTTVRVFTADDYAAMTRLHNANFPEFIMRDDDFQFEDEHRSDRCRWARWVAECEERVVGFGHYAQNDHVYHPRKFELGIVVDPAYHGRGIGGRLYDLVMRGLQPHNPLRVDEWSREDMLCRVGFLERRGFVADMRMWTSTIDLIDFEPSRFADQVKQVEAQGIRLRTFAELGVDDPGVRHKLYDLWIANRGDVPLPPSDVRSEVSFENWWERTGRPDLLPAGYFVALDGDEYVGTSQLWHSPDDCELRTGLTAVRRDYRRRGIALALKVKSLEFGKAQGYLRAVTENEINNRGMIGINDRLGFFKQPAYVHYLKSFET